MQQVITAAAHAATVGFFQEANGDYSSMRLMSFLSLCAAIGFALLGVLGKGSAETPTYVLGFLTAAFGPKVVQKPFEEKPAAFPS